MSFAGEVKQELLEQTGKSRNCQLAELAALFSSFGQVVIGEDGDYTVKFATENLTVWQKCYILVKKAFHIVPDLSIRGHHQFLLYILDDEDALAFMKEIQVLDGTRLAAAHSSERSADQMM